MKLQVLVTTMHQTDFSKLEAMNLKGNALLANQADFFGYEKTEKDGACWELFSTKTRGSSRNRNIAIEFSDKEADLLMFSDDDLVFSDGYEKIIFKEFENHPQAEAIQFHIYNIGTERKVSMSKGNYRKATRRNVTSQGVWGLVIKREVLLKKNLRFNEHFGPGSDNYCGEDTIFLQDLIKKKVKFYLSPLEIAGINQAESTWFKGYNKRVYYTAGMVLCETYPSLAKLLAIRSTYKAFKRKESELSFREILKSYMDGIKDYKKGQILVKK